MINGPELASAEAELVGRELDATVARHVMGWVARGVEQLPPNHWPWRKPDGEYTYALPAYSVDYYAIWDVIERMRELGFSFHAKSWIKTADVEVRFSDWYAANGGNGIISYAIARDFPLAVCKAALKAISEKASKRPDAAQLAEEGMRDD